MKRNSIFIIAEAGSNWRMGSPQRDMQMAKTLIDIAVDAGANAVKFQTYRPETVYVENAGNSDYLSECGINESIRDIFKDLSMPYEMIPELYDYCKSNSIEFMSTPFSVEDAKHIDPFVQKHKIASYEITHMRLLEYVATTQKPLILSTGAATPEEIRWAVDFFKKNGGNDLSLMQVTAKYPAPLHSLNLGAIKHLIDEFDIPVGLSDHSRDPLLAPIAAVALGASIIEKHYTLHNKLPGPDHSFAVTPDELKKMVSAIRGCEESLGTGTKIIQPEENELRSFAQRGIQCIKPIKKGEAFHEDSNVAILRSGKQQKGIHPKHIVEIEGKFSKRNIGVGEGILRQDYE